MKRLTVAFITAVSLFVGTAAAQIKYVAVVETELDAQSGADAKMNKAEVRQVTAELRSVAVKNLPRDKYNIMTSETVMAQGSARLEECSEENCVIALGNMIGADYIVRGLVSKFGTSLTLSVEMYETVDGNLVATSGLVRSENVVELLDKAAAVCADMFRTFAATQRPAPKAPATPAAPAAPVNYTVTAIANPPHGGAVSRNPSQTYYASGTKVNVMATPAAGYRFVGWSGDAAGDASLITVTADGAKTLTANFQYIQRTYKLTTNISPAGGGSVARSPDREAYTAGERVTVTAAPGSGYTFTGWTGAEAGRSNRLTVTMDGDKAVTANFYKQSVRAPTPPPTAIRPYGATREPTAPKPDAGLAQEPPRKRHTLAALGLDAAGAGIFLYGVAREFNVRDNINDLEWTAADKSAKQRNAAYVVGSIILLSGISVHIFF